MMREANFKRSMQTQESFRAFRLKRSGMKFQRNFLHSMSQEDIRGIWERAELEGR